MENFITPVFWSIILLIVAYLFYDFVTWWERLSRHRKELAIQVEAVRRQVIGLLVTDLIEKGEDPIPLLEEKFGGKWVMLTEDQPTFEPGGKIYSGVATRGHFRRWSIIHYSSSSSS